MAVKLSTCICAALFVTAIVSSAIVGWQHAVPVLTLQARGDHGSHFPLLIVHTLGGLAMLVFGASALFIGWTRKGLRWHKIVGYSYVGLGSVGAIAALWLSVLADHKMKGFFVATGTLAFVWLCVAAMAVRAARNRRFDCHRQWMIRSYVLTWTFVGCRLAGILNYFPGLDADGALAATIWINWIVPLVVCEIALQWKSGSRLAVPAGK